MLKFGDVFRYGEKKFVWFVKIDDVLYAAEILDKKNSNALEKLRCKNFKSSLNSKKKQDYSIYYFVILKTEPFQERAAHVGEAKGRDACSQNSFEVIKSLEKEDIKALLAEIKDAPVPVELKKEAQKIKT
jgi:hypothetical protein